jgi:hypothetical protein
LLATIHAHPPIHRPREGILRCALDLVLPGGFPDNAAKLACFERVQPPKSVLMKGEHISACLTEQAAALKRSCPIQFGLSSRRVEALSCSNRRHSISTRVS